jgi:hypothetical protein
MSDKLNIGNEMKQFDIKNRQFYDELTDEERKKFGLYLMIRWGSSVEGSALLQKFYIVAVNERLNKHYFDIKKEHNKLLWLLCTTVSPGFGSQRHKWIGYKKKTSNDNKNRKLLESVYPNAKSDEINTMLAIYDKSDYKKLLEAYGEE